MSLSRSSVSPPIVRHTHFITACTPTPFEWDVDLVPEIWITFAATTPKLLTLVGSPSLQIGDRAWARHGGQKSHRRRGACFSGAGGKGEGESRRAIYRKEMNMCGPKQERPEREKAGGGE